MDIPAYTREKSAAVDKALRRFLPPATARPETLHRAMRYSLFAGGKRLRPVLCLAGCETADGDPALAIPAACAIECIHTYSLIHDDLPCMDDDDFRRGKPSCHKVFGEAVAVLAGDALLATAFEIASHAPARAALAIVRELAAAAGSRKLVAGQVADLEAEGGMARHDIRFIHLGKTAAMIAASLRCGALSAGAPARTVNALGQFGQSLGLAFQVIDDILDATQPSEKLGKSAGKDARDGKSTYATILGLKAARREAIRLTQAAQRALLPLGSRADTLAQLADHLLAREF